MLAERGGPQAARNPHSVVLTEEELRSGEDGALAQPPAALSWGPARGGASVDHGVPFIYSCASVGRPRETSPCLYTIREAVSFFKNHVTSVHLQGRRDEDFMG